MPSADVWRFPSDSLKKKVGNNDCVMKWLNSSTGDSVAHGDTYLDWVFILILVYNAQLKNSDYSLNGNGRWIYISNMHRLLSLKFFSDNKSLLYYNSCMRPCACLLLTLPWIELNTWQCIMRKLKTLIIFWLWMLVKFWYQIYAQASEFWSLLTMKFPIL